MTRTPPPVLNRDAASFRDEVAGQLQVNVGWNPADPASDQSSAALLGVFARFCEIFTQRLNRAPEKNFLAFLDLLGTSVLPPQPSRVPLTFTLAAESPVDTVVPAGTRAAAAPAPGGKDPVIFETERELSVVAAKLQALFSADGAADLLADHSALLENPSNEGDAVFSSDRVNEHVLYIGHPFLGLESLKELRIEVDAEEPAASGQVNPFNHGRLTWEAWDGTSWRQLGRGLLTLGALPLRFPRTAGLQPTVAQTIGGVTSFWMRACWQVPISSTQAALLPTYRQLQVGALVERQSLRPDAVFMNDRPLDTLRPFYPFGEQPKLGDALYIGSREAFARPGTKVVLRLPVVNPTPVVNLTETTADGGSVLPTQASDDLQLKWEIWNGTAWFELGTSSPKPDPEEDPAATIKDGTRAFTFGGTRGSDAISIQLPDGSEPARTAQPVEINGVTSCWIRVRIVAGSYGRDARFVDDDTLPAKVRFEPATFAPPLVESLRLSYSAELPPEPAEVVSFNNLQFENLRPVLARRFPVMPFRSLPDLPPSLYLAFTIPAGRAAFPNRAVSLYHNLKPAVYGEQAPLAPRVRTQVVVPGASETRTVHHFTLTNPGTQTARYELMGLGGSWLDSINPREATLPPGTSTDVTVGVVVPPAAQIAAGTVSDVSVLHIASGGRVETARIETRIAPNVSSRRSVRWEYWNGASWLKLAVRDDTGEFTRSGIVEFLGPGDIARSSFFGVNAYWVRVILVPDASGQTPLLQSLLPNTTFASQVLTLSDEHLGSSDATANQKFHTTRAPVLASPQLEVREPGSVTGAELEALQAAHGASDVTREDSKGGGATWVRWIEAADFYASLPGDRHYVLDHITGEVRFGNGVQGRIPPRGTGNIRMARYQIGGGSLGNVAAGTIVQMKTSVPLIDTVSNSEPAAGGVDTESNAALMDRGPRVLRHGNRAVAVNDYEDLARIASPEVARAKCVPLRELQRDPLGATPVAGAASVIIVPGSSEPKPQPTLELLARVEEYLRAHQAVTAEVVAVGPLYVRVDVSIEVALVRLEGASLVEEAIRAALAAFLHPLTGGREGTGWQFGRQPHLSDLHAVVGAIAGVDHIRKLTLAKVEEPSGAESTGWFLIYSGQHDIELSFRGAQ